MKILHLEDKIPYKRLKIFNFVQIYFQFPIIAVYSKNVQLSLYHIWF